MLKILTSTAEALFYKKGFIEPYARQKRTRSWGMKSKAAAAALGRKAKFPLSQAILYIMFWERNVSKEFILATVKGNGER